jgi:hypothetical protein
VRGREDRGDWGWLIAIVPALFVVLFEGMAWIAVAVTGSERPAGWGTYALGVAVLAGIVAPLALVITRRRDALIWVVVSICVSLVGLFVGALLWFAAILDHCNGVCLG